MPPPATVIAFHAGGVGPSAWDEVRRHAPELTFVTPHLGHEAEAAGGRADTFLDRLEALLPDGDCIFTGQSLGTLFALELAARAGARTRGVLLMSSGPPVEDAGWLAKVKGMMSFMSDGFDPAFVASLVNVLMYRGGSRFSQLAEGLRAQMLKEGGAPSVALAQVVTSRPRLAHHVLPEITAPIHVWFGQYDPTWEDGWSAAWTKVAHVSRIDAVAHAIAMEVPDRVAMELRKLAHPDPGQAG